MPEHEIVFPSDTEIAAECKNDTDVTYLLPIQCTAEDGNCLLSPGAWTNLGCWADDPSDEAIWPPVDHFLELDLLSRKKPIKECAEFAYSRGYSVFALQNGGICYTSSNAEKTYTKHGSSAACGTNGKGGVNANQVYKFVDYYAWKFESSMSRGLPIPGMEISRTCSKSNGKPKIIADEDCEVRLSYRRRKCHHWHEDIGKQECLAHGCCFDDYINIHSGTIQCFERRDSGYFSGPNIPVSRTHNRLFCQKPKKKACEYLSNTCHEMATCLNDRIFQNEIAHCYCNEGYIGDGHFCVELQQCPPSWNYTKNTTICSKKFLETDNYNFTSSVPISLAPSSLFVELTSRPPDSRAFGFERIEINRVSSKQVNWNQELEACVLLMTFNNVGEIVFELWIYNNHDSVQTRGSIAKFFREETQKATYFSVTSSGFLKDTLMSLIIEELNEMEINIENTEYDIIPQGKYELLDEVVYTEKSDEIIFHCKCVKDVTEDGVKCLGSAIHIENDVKRCRLYYEKATNDTQMNITTVKKTDNIRISYQEQELSATGVTAELQCPFPSLTPVVMAVDATYTLDESLRSVSGKCNKSPCVIQLACPWISYKDDTMDDLQQGPLGLQLVCRRFTADIVKCPLVEQFSVFNGMTSNSVQVLLSNGDLFQGVYLDMDELLNLGAPSIAYSTSELSNNTFKWRPLEWLWINDEYPDMVFVGVKNRAIKFSGQEARTQGDICWGRLGDPILCRLGTTISFWFRILEFPSSSHLRILDTGVWEMTDECGGISAFIDPLDLNLHLVVALNQNKMWSVVVPIKKMRWYHVMLSWSERDGLWTNINKGEFVRYAETHTGKARIFKQNVTEKINCNDAMLRIGNFKKNEFCDGSFQIDELYLFPERYEEEFAYEIAGLSSALPIHHEFNGHSSYTNANSCSGEEAEEQDVLESIESAFDEAFYGLEPTFRCFEFEQSCLGSSIRCVNGITIAFTITINAELTLSELNALRPDTVVGNIPVPINPGQSPSYGFSVYLDYIKAASSGATQDQFYMRITTSTNKDGTYAKTYIVLKQGISYFFILQMSRHGKWRLIQDWPNENRVLSNVGTPLDPRSLPEELLNATDPHTQFIVGPTILNEKSLFQVDLKVIEEDLDLVVVFNEFHGVTEPYYWPLVDDDLKTKSGKMKFVKNGAIERINAMAVMGTLLNNTELYDADQSYASIELPPQEMAALPCLANIDECWNGFTVQFWMQIIKCSYNLSENCVFVTSMPTISSSSKGFAIYKSSSDNYLHILIQTSSYRVESVFIIPQSHENKFILLRISWHPIKGLSVFINDVLKSRMSPEDNNLLDISQESSVLSIGCCANDNTSCSTMRIHDFYYWDAVVEGKPFTDLAHSCSSSMTQIGEACFLVALTSYDSLSESQEFCETLGGNSASIPTLAHYAILTKLIGNSLFQWATDFRAENGKFFWEKAGITVDETKFVPIPDVSQVDVTAEFLFIGNFLQEQSAENQDGTICEIPFVHDPFYYGCVQIEQNILDVKGSLLEIHTETSENSLGTYNFAQACSIGCLNEKDRSLSAITSGNCYCISGTMEDYNIPKVSHWECKSSIQDGKISLGKFGISSDNNFHPDHCGSIQMGGSYKCNKNDSQSVTSSIYASLYDRYQLTLKPTRKLLEFGFSIINNQINVSSIYSHIIFEIQLHLFLCKSSMDYPAFDTVDSNCDGVLIDVNYDFNNDVSYDLREQTTIQATNFRLYHYYEQPGEYEITVTISANKQGETFNNTKTLTIRRKPDTIVLSHLSIPFGNPGEKIKVQPFSLSGEDIRCLWDFKDDTPLEKTSHDSVPIPSAYHKFKNPGVYENVYVRCNNEISIRHIFATAFIDYPINLLEAEQNVVLNFESESYEHSWRVFGGSNIVCKVKFGNTIIPEKMVDEERNDLSSYFQYDEKTSKGKAILNRTLYYDVGKSFVPATYIVSVMCYNSATDPVPIALTYLIVEREIKNLTAEILGNKKYFLPNEEMIIFVNIKEGQNIQLGWDFDEDPDKNFVEICGNDNCEERKVSMKYPYEGIYNITVTASNALTSLKKTLEIVVEISISPFSIKATDVPMPNDDVEIILIHPVSEALFPTPGLVEFRYSSDDDDDVVFLYFETTSGELLHLHKFKSIGIYGIEAYAYNNVSNFNISTSVQVGKNISELQLTVASSRYLRTNMDQVDLHITMQEGSEVTYLLSFGDENITRTDPYMITENKTRSHSIVPDFNYVKHYYMEPGNYTCSVVAENVFGREEFTISEEIIVQNPLDGDVILFLAPINTVPYPPGDLVLNASLQIIKESIVPLLNFNNIDGYANNVHMKIYLDEYLLLKKYGEHESDLFPVNITLPKNKVGNVNIAAKLENSVSSKAYIFNFMMSELIENILVRVSADAIDSIVETISDTRFYVDSSINEKIVFKLSTIKGSHVRYNVFFGDGNNSTIESTTLYGSERFVTTKYAYDHPGVYDIFVTAENDVSKSNLMIKESIRIYQRLSSVVMMTNYLNNDNFDFTIDDPNDYGLEERISGHKFRNSRYFPLSKTLLLTAFISSGSNATFTWILNEEGLSITRTLEDGVFNVVNLTHPAQKWIVNGSYGNDKILIGLDRTAYTQSPMRSTLFVKYKNPGKQIIMVNVSNAISSQQSRFELVVEDEVKDAKFIETEPPLANLTTNMTFCIGELGTDSCMVLNWGDGTPPAAFGFNEDFCIQDQRIVSDIYRNLSLNKNESFVKEKQITSVMWPPKLKQYNSTMPSINITVSHTYVVEGIYQASLSAFNRVSQSSEIKTIVVIKILCDYPRAQIDKSTSNSRSKPREVLKSLPFDLYSFTMIRCLISSQTSMTWSVYKEYEEEDTRTVEEQNDFFEGLSDGQRSIHAFVKENYISDKYYYRFYPGLSYTSRSETIRIPRRFMMLNISLVCVNVAMVGVVGISTTDCIYIKVNPTPLVAGVIFGNARTVGHDEIIKISGIGASYDPDISEPEGGLPDYSRENNDLGQNLFYHWSVLFLTNTSAGDFSTGGTQEQIDMVFGNLPKYKEVSVCVNKNIELLCPNQELHINIFNVTLYNSADGSECDLSTSHCSTEKIMTNLMDQCQGSHMCTVEPLHSWFEPDNTSYYQFSPWLTGSGDAISGSGSILELITESSNCFKFIYRCRMPDEYIYFQPSSSCISSGYYLNNQDYEKGLSSINLENVNGTTCPNLTVDASKLKKNTSYIIFVNVTDPITKRKALSFQILNITEGAPPTLRIQCVVNCKGRVNSFKVLSLNVGCTSCKPNSKISYKWSLLVQLDKNGTFLPEENFDNFTLTGKTLPALVLRAQTLKPGLKYRIQATGFLPGYLPGMTFQDVLINLPPFGGQCDIFPKSGNCLNQTFTIVCRDWKDEGINAETGELDNTVTLKYEVWYQKHSSATPYLLSSGNNPVIADKYLAPGIEDEEYWVTLYVNIVDGFGDKAKVPIKAKVFEISESLDQVLQNMTSATVSTSGAQVTSQFSQMAGELLNSQVAQDINSTKGTSPDVQEENKKNRAKMRSQLVEAVTQKSSYDNNLEGVQQASSALKSLLETPDEVGNETQLAAVNALSDMASSLAGVASLEAPEDLEEAASDLVGALDNVVNAAIEQVVSASGPSFTLPPPTTASAKEILDENEEYLSPEERIEYRKQKEKESAEIHAANREQAQRVGGSALGSIFSLSSSLMKQKQPGEPSVKLSGKDMTVEIERKTAASLCSNDDDSTNKGFKLPCGSSFLDGLDAEDIIDVEVVVSKNNPFIWDDSADNINSDIISLNLNLPNNKEINSTNSTSSFRIEVPTKKTKYRDPELFTFSPSGLDEMSYHEVNLNKPEDVIFLTIAPEEDANIRLYFELAESLKTFPNLVNNSLVLDVKDVADNVLFPGRIRLDIDSLGTTGRFVFGIHEIDYDGNVKYFKNMTWQNYTLHTFTTSCRYWNETLEKWETDGCVVSSETTEDKIVCLCSHLTSFGADFFVAPNPIDFAVIAQNIGDLANNLAVLLTLVAIFVLFILGLIFFRRKDKQDIEKWSVSPLLDNQLIHTYFYQMTIRTGKWNNSGTKSKIYFMLSGEDGDTPVRRLSTKDNMVFKKNEVTKVILSTHKPLGTLNYIRVWHDNSGDEDWASWYLDSLLITDLQTNDKNYFLCDDWLAVDQSDGSVDRVILPAGSEEIESFKNLFNASTRRDFSDGHLWFSMFSRPTKSNFTRCQRLCCGVTLLLCTMLASAMFYGREADNSNKQGIFEIGPIKFSVQQVMISVQSSLIVIPINLLLVQMFRKLAPNKKNNGSVSKSAQNILSTISLHNVIKNEEEEEKEKAKMEIKQPFMFPHWCLYIAWTIVVLTSLSCAGVVFLYSIMWGPEKSIDWLTSIIFSFTQSVFIIQPIKVVVAAIIFSVFVKRIASNKAKDAVAEVMEAEQVENDRFQDICVKLEEQEEWLLRFPDDDLDDETHTQMLPPSPDVLEKSRREMLKRKRMVSTAYEILSYLCYVLLLLVASNSAKDPNAFKYHESLSSVFVKSGDPSFNDVRSFDDFWSWCNGSLVDALFAPDWYNGKKVKFSESRFISDRASFVLGPARLRQIRVIDDVCVPPGSSTKITSRCFPQYDFYKEETKDFLPFWKLDLSHNASEKATPWTYQSFIDLGGYLYEGRIHMYSGGGYAAILGNTPKQSRNILQDLKSHDWIDHYTRGIFVELTVYNANINLFGSLLLLFERAESGHFEPHVKIYAIRLFEFIDGKGYLLVGIYAAFLLVLIYKWYRIIKHIMKQKLSYLKDFWNMLDFVSSVLSIVLIPLYAIRYIQAQYILNKLKRDPDKETFVNFQYITIWNDTFRYLMSFIVFFAIVRFIRLLRFNRRIRMLTNTLKISAIPLLSFASMFALYFTSFLFLSWLWFEQKIYSFSTLLLAAEEMIVMMLGRFDFTELKQADRMLGPIFFSTFTLACTIALVNMFVVLLDEGIKKARIENETTANEFELVDFLTKKVKEGIISYLPSYLSPSNKAKYKSKTETAEKPFASPDYIHYPDEILLRRLDTIADRVADLEKFWIPEEKLPTIDELEAELIEAERIESFSSF
ncbi:uncharacterized protein LOC120348022 [Styela clava]